MCALCCRICDCFRCLYLKMFKFPPTYFLRPRRQELTSIQVKQFSSSKRFSIMQFLNSSLNTSNSISDYTRTINIKVEINRNDGFDRSAFQTLNTSGLRFLWYTELRPSANSVPGPSSVLFIRTRVIHIRCISVLYRENAFCGRVSTVE